MFTHLSIRTGRPQSAVAGILAITVLLSCGGAVMAQDSRQPSAAEIIRKLTPAEAPAARGAPPDQANAPDAAGAPAETSSPRIRTRGIRVENRIPTVQPPANPDQQVATVQAPPSLDLEVNFEYASAKLTPDARIVLDSLGQALNDPTLRESRMRIAGHTDAKGADAYNVSLSRQRAQSVAEYLSRQHGVDTRRLSVEGYGRSQLLDPANPESAVNRRVQVVNLGKIADSSGK